MEYLEWIEIPAGKFWMGDDNGHQEEKPCHLIDLPTYWIAKTPITNAQYLQFIEATHANMPTHWENGAIPSGKENHPVSLVSWPDAVAFASWVGGKIGQTVLLPSDAEWEKAARGGLMLPSGKNPLPKRNYPWGNVFDEAKCNMKASGIEETTPVGNYPYGASPYGVLDMAGNVWEWTRSLFKPYPYVATDGREDPNPYAADGREELNGGRWHSLRGGSWWNQNEWGRCATRLRKVPHFVDDIGMRLVVLPY